MSVGCSRRAPLTPSGTSTSTAAIAIAPPSYEYSYCTRSDECRVESKKLLMYEYSCPYGYSYCTRDLMGAGSKVRNFESKIACASAAPSPLRSANQITRIALREFCVRHVIPTASYFLANPTHDCDCCIPISDTKLRWVGCWIVSRTHI